MFFLLDKTIEYIKLGDIHPYSQQPIGHRSFIVSISLYDNEEKDIYVRIFTSSSMQVPIFIWHPDYFFEALINMALAYIMNDARHVSLQL
jgi:hypothetical protein